jgi:tetratricopeptide (TPR) repeat protein
VAAGDKSYEAYLKERAANKSSPAFYLDCADFFAKAKQPELALRILTNIPELALDDGRLIRIAAHRLHQLGHLDLAIDLFEKVSKLRPEEPQSFRDLALALAARADHEMIMRFARRLTPPTSEPLNDYQKALNLLHRVVMNPWQRFEEIEVLALMEANRLIARINQLATGDSTLRTISNPFDPRLIKLLDLDVRVVMTWDTDNTDIDLHVVEPSGETAFYSHNRTTIGGLVSRDFTQGYGPEEYCLRKLMPGQYQIKAHFYGNRDQKLVGPTTLQATIITNFGRVDEKREAITLRLTDAKDWVDIGTVTLGNAK